METGTTVYINWYDFEKKAEQLCKGVVEDNSLWADTQWRDHICVSFRPPSLKNAICHHFLPEKVSTDINSVPHDDCYLVCGKHAIAEAAPKQAVSMSDASERLIRFKQEHWDDERNHLQTEYLDEFCELWREVIALRMGMKITKPVTNTMNMDHPTTPAEAIALPKLIVSDEKMEEIKTELKRLFKEPTAKEKRSTGRIQYKNATQTSIFDI